MTDAPVARSESPPDIPAGSRSFLCAWRSRFLFWKPSRGTLLWFILLSVTYVAVELRFNVFLVDELGLLTPQDDETINFLELWGRRLSGVALALVFIGVPHRLAHACCIPPTFWGKILLLSIFYGSLGFVAVAVATTSIEYVVEAAAKSTSADYRRDVMLASFVVTELKARENEQSRLSLNGRDIRELSRTVEGRFVLASLPFLMSLTPDLERRVGEAARDIIREDLIRSSSHCKTMGPPDQYFRCAYDDPLNEWIRPLYSEGYIKAADAFHKVRKEVPQRAQNEWEGYVTRLSRRGLTPERASGFAYANRVRSEVRKDIPELPANWNPADKKTFIETVERRVLDQARIKYMNLLKGLGIDGFIEPLAVQNPQAFVENEFVRNAWTKHLNKWKAGSNLTQFGLRFPVNDAVRLAFRRDVYVPVLDGKISEAWERLAGDARQYLDDGRYGQEALKITKIAIVIPIALLFSLLGIILHMGKLTYIFSRVAGMRGPVPIATALVALILVTIAVSSLQDPAILDDKAVKRMAEGVHRTLPSAPILFPLALKLEACLYPLGERLAFREVAVAFCWHQERR